MSEVDGATLIARSLKQQGIDHLFGVAPSTSLMFSDRKSTRLNSSHSQISYAVFCLKKKNNISSIVMYLTHWCSNLNTRLDQQHSGACSSAADPRCDGLLARGHHADHDC